MSSEETPKKEEFSEIPLDIDVSSLPSTLKEIEHCYNELSNNALNDNFFMSCFWKSFGVTEMAEAALSDYLSELKIIKEYNDRIKSANLKK